MYSIYGTLLSVNLMIWDYFVKGRRVMYDHYVIHGNPDSGAFWIEYDHDSFPHSVFDAWFDLHPDFLSNWHFGTSEYGTKHLILYYEVLHIIHVNSGFKNWFLEHYFGAYSETLLSVAA